MGVSLWRSCSEEQREGVTNLKHRAADEGDAAPRLPTTAVSFSNPLQCFCTNIWDLVKN